MSRFRPWILVGLGLGVSLLAAGCGQKPIPVKGVVLFEDRPLAGAFVQFIALEEGGRDAHGLADANGPGRLCRVMGIDLQLNGVDLTTGESLWLEPGRRRRGERIVRTTRIGIRHDVELPWRFYLFGSPGVSRRDRAAEADGNHG